MARLDVPGALELELRILREAKLLGALPRLPQVAGAMNGRSIDFVVRAGVEDTVTRIQNRVIDGPPHQVRPIECPPLPQLVASEEKEPLFRSGEHNDRHRLELFRSVVGAGGLCV